MKSKVSKYIAYKIFEADGWTDEGKALINSNAVDGFGVVHEDYVILSLQSELKQGMYSVCSSEQKKDNKKRKGWV